MTDTEVKLTAFVRDWLQTSEARLYEHVSHMFRWLLATLFAANGGAILSILSFAKESGNSHPIAIRWFAVGLLFSIGMGIASAFIGLRMSTLLQKARIETEKSLAGADADGEPMKDLIERTQTTWKRFVPTYIGIASFLCLITGMLIVAGEM